MTDKFREPEEELPELRSLPRETPLPPNLEDRVMAALRRNGLLAARPIRGWSLAGRAAAAAAAAVLLFASGWMMGARRPSAVPVAHQPTFVLLLRDGLAYQPAKEGEQQQRVAEYRAWAQKLSQAGIAISGEKLKDEAQVLTGPGAEALPHERPGEALGVIGGFFFLNVPDAQQAADIAKDCPHLRHGGTIEIRPIDPT